MSLNEATMENWIMRVRMILLLYCILCFVQGPMEKLPLVLLVFLGCICSSMLIYFVKRKAVARLYHGINIMVLVVSMLFLHPLFIVLLVPDIFELTYSIWGNLRYCIAMLCLPLLISTAYQPEYIMAAFMMYLVYLLSSKYIELYTKQKTDVEILREKNEVLSNKIYAGAEYGAQVRLMSEMETRNNVAQRIHDRVGHTLAGSIIQLEAASMILEKDSQKAQQMLHAVTENLKEGMDDIRSTLRSIKPAPEQLGVNRLKLILEEFTLNHQIKTSFSFDGSLDVISHLHWKIMIENVTEVLTNVLKHASATNIIVRLDVMNRLIKMEVRDNGNGAVSIQKGMGLAGIEERTELLGGKLIVDGSNGFSVITLLPAQEVEHANTSISCG